MMNACKIVHGVGKVDRFSFSLSQNTTWRTPNEIALQQIKNKQLVCGTAQRSLKGDQTNSWLLAMMSAWNICVQRLYVSKYQLLEGNIAEGLLPSGPFSVVSQKHQVNKQDVRLNGPLV